MERLTTGELVRLAYLSLVALALWGVAALVKRGANFGPVLATGCYALVPAVYARFMLPQVGVNFVGLLTFLLLPLWAIALAAAFLPRQADPAPASIGAIFRAERPLHGWRAWMALPLLLDFALEVIFDWRASYVTWPLAFLTFAALVAVSLWPLAGILK